MEQKKKRLSILKKSVRYESSPTQTFTKSNRRISFSGTKSVKEFIAGEDKATIWGTSYEEEDRNHASIASAQEISLPDMSTTTANASHGMMLRNRRIIPINTHEDNKENFVVETTYDTMELANTQHIATAIDNRTFNNTMDLTLNSFELKHIKFSKPAMYEKTSKNVEIKSEEISLNNTSHVEMDSDISQNMYCSFVNEQDRKLVLQNRLANKVNKTHTIGKSNEGNNMNRFECEIDNFNFGSTYPDKARQVLIDKSNSDLSNKSIVMSPTKLDDNNIAGKNEFGRKTIVFQRGEAIDESYEVSKQMSFVGNSKSRQTILLTEELDLENNCIPRNEEINEAKNSELGRFVSANEDMVIDTTISHSQKDQDPENGGKRKTIIFATDENVDNGSDLDDGFCAEDAHRKNRKTVVFPMGEVLQTDHESNANINPSHISKSRQTLLFEGGQKIDEDQAVAYSFKVSSDLKEKSIAFSGVDIETEAMFYEAPSETNKKNEDGNQPIDLLCANDRSRKTLMFKTGENIDVSFYKSPLLRAQLKRMTQVFRDAEMEVDETFSEVQKTKAKDAPLSNELSKMAKSRLTQIFPSGEKIKETMDSSSTAIAHHASKATISRHTLVFEKGENINADYFKANPEETRRKTQLFRDDNIELDIYSGGEPGNCAKERQTILHDCTMDETICMNQGQNTNVSLSIFSKIQQKQTPKNSVSERFCNESGIELLEQFNRSMRNETFAETIQGNQSDRDKIHFKEEDNCTRKSENNRKTIVFEKGEELDIDRNVKSINTLTESMNSSKNFALNSVPIAEHVDWQLHLPKERKTLLLKNDNMNIDNIEIQPHENAAKCKANPNRKTIVFSTGENIMEAMYESSIADKNMLITDCNKEELADTTSTNKRLILPCENSREPIDHAKAARRVLIFDNNREKIDIQNAKTLENVRRATCLFKNEGIDIEEDTSLHIELQKDKTFGANNTTNREEVRMHEKSGVKYPLPPKSMINNSPHNEILNEGTMKGTLKTSLKSHDATKNKSTLENTNYVHENIDTSYHEPIALKSLQIRSDDQKHTRRTIVYRQGEPVDLSESIAVQGSVSQTAKATDVNIYTSNTSSVYSECFHQTQIMSDDSFHPETALQHDSGKTNSVKIDQEQITDTKEQTRKNENRRATIIFRNGENINEESFEDPVVTEEIATPKSRIPILTSTKIPKPILPQAKIEQNDSFNVDNRDHSWNGENQNRRKTQVFQNEIIQTDNSRNNRLEQNMKRKTVITSSPGKHVSMEKHKSKLVPAPKSKERIQDNKNTQSSLHEMTLDEQKIDVDNEYHQASELQSNSQNTRRTIFFNEEIDEESEQCVEAENSKYNNRFYSQLATRVGFKEAQKSEPRDSSIRSSDYYDENTGRHRVKSSNILDQSHDCSADQFTKEENCASVSVPNKNRHTFTIRRDSRIEPTVNISDKAIDTFVVSKNSGNKDISAAECSFLISDTSEHPTRELSSSPPRTRRGTFMSLKINESRKSSDASPMGKATFTVYEDKDQTLKPNESKGFENNSPSVTYNNPNLFKKLTQDSIYLSRTACCPMGTESLLATGSSLTFSPNSTAALCNLDPNKITGAGYKRSFTKNAISDDTFYKQFKRDYAELTIDAIRESPDQYEVVADEITADDIDKTHIDLVDTIETISDSCDKIEVCEASVMLLNVVEGNQDYPNYKKDKLTAAEKSQMLCHKCKNCQKTILNDTTLAGFNLEKDMQNFELNFDALTKLEGKPRFRDVLNEFKERRLSNCFNSTYEESILFPTVPSAQFLLDNYAEGYMQNLEKENPTDGLNGAVCPVIPPYEVLFQNRLQENSPWIFDDNNLLIGLLRCRHKTVRGVCLKVKFQPQDLQNPAASNVSFHEILMEKCNIYQNPSVFDRVVHNEIFSRMSRDLTAFCCSSNQLFSFLESVDVLFHKARQLVKELLKTIFLNHALLKCDESGNCIARKTVCGTTNTTTMGSKVEFQIRIRNVEKICSDDILLPPRSYFKDDVQSLPKGLKFVEIFLRDPIKYLK